ncbi:MAG: histidine--tRNA ligase [bacterium]
MISRVRGTQDYIDLVLYNFALDGIKKHLALYNFSEIQTPILEHTELFVHSLGSDTDVVSKEMYVFESGGEASSEKSICLRPEGTAPVIRACFENSIQRFPWKVFMHGPMFRRERPQKGRYRQFHQTTVEVVGSLSIAQDVQLIKMFDALFSQVFKLEDYILKINFLGCLNDRKEHKNQLRAFLDQNINNICQTCVARKDTNTLRVFDCKNEACAELYKNAPKLTQFLCETCAQEWTVLQKNLEMLSVSHVIDPTLVRGLDYYNKTVFEFASMNLGSQNAFLGGGRYNLGHQVGAKQDYECVGAAIGMERLLLLIEQNKNKYTFASQQALHVILPLSLEQHSVALLLAQDLQDHGFATEIVFEKASMTNMMKKADKLGASFALIIGDDEQKNGTVSVKNMSTGVDQKIAQSELVTFLKK